VFELVGLLALGLALVSAPGCEDTDVVAPSGSSITLTASPASVTINQEIGQTRGNSTIIAQLLAESGTPLANIPLIFSSNGGLLGSVDNQCVTGSCAATGGTCVLDADCPAVTPGSVETDSNGIAIDVLTIRLAEDPSEVTVMVRSTASSEMVTVGTNVSAGPQAQINVTPQNGVRTGTPVTFLGVTQTGIPITCFEWTITSNIPSSNETVYTTEPSIQRTYGTLDTRIGEQDLQVRLRVSGQRGSCRANSGLPFSQFEDTISYLVRCDFTDPSVNPGSDVVRSLSNSGGEVTVAVNATAFDAEDPDLEYQWDCRNGESVPPGASAACRYDTEGTFNPRVTVVNTCGRFVTAGITVQINP
jgi:hypothetical protein